jgi:hypothetical protein
MVGTPFGLSGTVYENTFIDEGITVIVDVITDLNVVPGGIVAHLLAADTDVNSFPAAVAVTPVARRSKPQFNRTIRR